MLEIWKIYKEYDTPWNAKNPKHHIIEVSNMGRIKKDDKIVDLSKYEHQRYYYICSTHIHRAVAELFIPNPENKPCIDHINTNKHDNKTENLRWVTYSENMLNEITRKLNSNIQKVVQRGEKNSMYGKHQKESTKKLIAEDHYERTFVNNGIIEKFPKIYEINKYLNNGFVVGRLPFSKETRKKQSNAKKKQGTQIHF